MIETRRLRLEPFSIQDLEILHQTFTDPFVRKYLWDNEIIPLNQTREVLEVNETCFPTGRWGLWKVIARNDKSYVGFVGLWRFFDEHQPQLLFGLMPDKPGMGYATEAAQSIINYSFNVLNFDFLIASFDTPHKASRKVCERLGMHHTKDEIMNAKPTSFYRIDRESYNQKSM